MKRKRCFQQRLHRSALLDGLIHTAIFALLHAYVPSVYAAEVRGEVFFILVLVGAVISALVYLLLFGQVKRGKPLAVFTAAGVLWAAAFLLLHHCMIFFTPLRLLPVRDPLYDVEGLLLLMILTLYLLSAAALRLMSFIALLVRNLCMQSRESPHGAER